jgi:hypothetical protein
MYFHEAGPETPRAPDIVEIIFGEESSGEHWRLTLFLLSAGVTEEGSPSAEGFQPSNPNFLHKNA